MSICSQLLTKLSNTLMNLTMIKPLKLYSLPPPILMMHLDAQDLDGVMTLKCTLNPTASSKRLETTCILMGYKKEVPFQLGISDLLQINIATRNIYQIPLFAKQMPICNLKWWSKFLDPMDTLTNNSSTKPLSSCINLLSLCKNSKENKSQ